jgi:hypothetical protein
VDFFGALIEKIQSVGFAPLAPLEKSKPTYTLHTVVRDQLGMAERREVSQTSVDSDENQTKLTEFHITSDMADVSFWNYKELRNFLRSVHGLMDAEATSWTGKPTMAMAWAHEQSRTQEDIINLFESLQIKHPSLEVPKQAQKRISAKLMVQNGRVEASIANTLAVLVADGSDYGDLLEQCSRLNLDNEQLLDHLDSLVETAKANKEKLDKISLIPRELVVAYMKKKADSMKSDMRMPTMCQFLNSMNDSNNFAGNSDETILTRLLAVSGQPQ